MASADLQACAPYMLAKNVHVVVNIRRISEAKINLLNKLF